MLLCDRLLTSWRLYTPIYVVCYVYMVRACDTILLLLSCHTHVDDVMTMGSITLYIVHCTQLEMTLVLGLAISKSAPKTNYEFKLGQM